MADDVNYLQKHGDKKAARGRRARGGGMWASFLYAEISSVEVIVVVYGAHGADAGLAGVHGPVGFGAGAEQDLFLIGVAGGLDAAARTDASGLVLPVVFRFHGIVLGIKCLLRIAAPTGASGRGSGN